MDIDEALESLGKAPQEYEKLAKILNDYEGECNRIQVKLDDEKNRLKKAQNIYYEKKIENAHLRNKINEIETDIVARQYKLSNLLNETCEIQKKSMDFQDKLADSRVELHRKAEDLAEYRNRMSLHERRVQDEIQERINSDPEIRRIRDLKSLLTLKNKKLENESQSEMKESLLISSIDDLKEQIKVENQNLNRNQMSLNALKVKELSLKTMRITLSSDVESKENQISNARGLEQCIEELKVKLSNS